MRVICKKLICLIHEKKKYNYSAYCNIDNILIASRYEPLIKQIFKEVCGIEKYDYIENFPNFPKYLQGNTEE